MGWLSFGKSDDFQAPSWCNSLIHRDTGERRGTKTGVKMSHRDRKERENQSDGGAIRFRTVLIAETRPNNTGTFSLPLACRPCPLLLCGPSEGKKNPRWPLVSDSLSICPAGRQAFQQTQSVACQPGVDSEEHARPTQPFPPPQSALDDVP